MSEVDMGYTDSAVMERRLLLELHMAELGGMHESSAQSLAEKLGVTAGYVIRLADRLAFRGLADRGRYGRVSLSEAGEAEAMRMLRRRRIAESFCKWLGVEAEVDAMSMDDTLSDAVLEAIEVKMEAERQDHGENGEIKVHVISPDTHGNPQHT